MKKEEDSKTSENEENAVKKEDAASNNNDATIDMKTENDDGSPMIVKLKSTSPTNTNNAAKTKDGDPNDDTQIVAGDHNVLADIMGVHTKTKRVTRSASKSTSTIKRRQSPRRKKKLALSGIDYNENIKAMSKRVRKKPATALSSSSEDENQIIAPRKKIYRKKRQACPKCRKTFDSNSSFKYHIENNVCVEQKKAAVAAAAAATRAAVTRKRVSTSNIYKKFPEFDDRSKPMCVLPSYEDKPYKFCTKYGIVQIINDTNIPSDFGTSTVDTIKVKPEQTRRNLWKLRINARNNARKLTEYAKWQERRKWIDTLYKNFIYPDSKMSTSSTTTNTDNCNSCDVITDLKEKEDIQNIKPLPGIIAGEPLSIFKDKNDEDENKSLFMKRINGDTSDEHYPAGDVTLTYPPDEYIWENLLTPKDSYPERLVECLLVSDERIRVYQGQTHPYQATHDTTTVGLIQIRLYIQRQHIIKVYNDNFKKHICFDCGIHYSLRNNLMMHLKSKACFKRVLPTRPCDILKEWDLKSYKPLVSNKKKKRINRQNSVENAFNKVNARTNLASAFNEVNEGTDVTEVCRRVHPTKKTSTPSNKKQSTPTKQAATITSPKKKKNKKKPYKFAPCNSMYTPIFEYLGYQRKKMVVLKTIKTYGIYNQVLDYLQFRPGILYRRSTSVVRRQQAGVQTYFGIPAPPNKKRRRIRALTKCVDTYDGLVDIRVIVQEIKGGRYPSIKPFVDKRVDTKCNICKKKPTKEAKIYACEYCWRSCHIDCVYEKRPFLEFDPACDTFMCQICIGYVLAMRARAQRRKLKKMETLLGNKTTTKKKRQKKSNNPWYGSASEKGFATGEEDYDDGDETDGNITEKEDYKKNEYDNKQKKQPDNNVVIDRSLEDLMIKGKEMNELLQLTNFTQVRLKRAMVLSRSNDRRRSLFDDII